MSGKTPALTPARRDAGLRRLRVLNRILIGAAVLATGLLTDVAAKAFPGHKRAVRAGNATQLAAGTTAHRRSHARRHHAARHRRAAHHALSAPAQSPAASPAPAGTATASAPAASPPPSQPTVTQSTPAPAPAPAPAPVVSGGS